MRILFCIPTLGGGGAERQVRLLVKEFARRGVAIGLMTRFDRDDLEKFRELGVHCVPISVGNHDPRLPFLLLREIARGQWGIVQSWLAQMDVLVGLCANFGDFRWVLSERSAPIHYAKGWKNALRRRLAARADMIVANSPSGLGYWQSMAVPKALIPNAVDFKATNKNASRATHSEKKRRPLALSIGRFDHWKNFVPLIHAQAVLRERGTPVDLAILGDGELRSSFEQLIATLRLTDRVTLPGFVEDVLPWFRRADLFVSTSLYEGQPNAVLEAAAARVPAVLSSIQEHRDLMDGAAIFTDPHDPNDIAANIAFAIENRAITEEMTKIAYERVRLQSLEAVAARYLEIYDQLS